MYKSNILELKPINDLLDLSFYIPAYQRGYRWTKRQVIDLLDDIREFQRNSETSSKDGFYCLQPIVVKKYGSLWELVDGQQRLTTIFIILNYLKDILEILGKSPYQLKFETRENSADFLYNIDESKASDNIDFYHIFEAKKAVNDWFKSQDGTYKIKFLQTLLSSSEEGKNVQVIWYQLGEHENATDAFTRLNMGKIPLANAELVKALFLRSSNFDKKNKSYTQLQQINIAQEWDDIERRLQDDEFWYFLRNDKAKTNRIEFVLSLVAKSLPPNKDILDSDKIKVFIQFSRLFDNDNIDIYKEWLKIKQCYMTLEEWYKDRHLFHVIGYLISQGTEINTLFDYQKNTTKSGFRHYLKSLVFKTIFADKYHNLSKIEIDEYLQLLDKDKNSKKVHAVLLLFNVASLLENTTSNARFQFNKYKNENWDIEHIHSVTSDIPSGEGKQRIWLEDVISYISNNDLLNEQITEDDRLEYLIKQDSIALIQSKFSGDQFQDIYQRIITHYDPCSAREVDHSIGNLTLLDSSTNRSYKNAIFPIKRACILELDKRAIFVPLCTKNVFLKYYSKKVDKMLYWEKKDREAYQQTISITLWEFFYGEGEINE